MDFIERLFHVAPDGGNGALEAIYLAVAAVPVAAIALRRRLRGALRRALEAAGRPTSRHRRHW